MLQHVNKVLIAKTAPASYTTVDALVDGDIALFNENKVIVKSATEAEAATALYIGVCVGKEDVYDQEGTKSTSRLSTIVCRFRRVLSRLWYSLSLLLRLKIK